MKKFLVLGVLVLFGAAGCKDTVTVDVKPDKVTKGGGPGPAQPCPPGRVCGEAKKCQCGLSDCTHGKSLCKCKAADCVCPK